MNGEMLRLLGVAAVIAAIYFAVVWAISVKIRNYGLLDVAWSYGIAILAPFYAWFATGDPLRKWLVAAVGIAWSLRLGSYILIRVLSHHPKEDPRYQTLRKDWPGAGRFLLFFELQALVLLIFSLPFLLASFNATPGLQWIEWLGLGIAALSFVGEGTADLQMQGFKANPANKDKVCRVGLWRYSRHPNYFFESMVWWGFFIFALGTPWGWVTIVCPLLMLWFLLKVTGIKLTEEYSLKSKGEAYRDYQRTTSAFIPWFPKKG